MSAHPNYIYFTNSETDYTLILTNWHYSSLHSQRTFQGIGIPGGALRSVAPPTATFSSLEYFKKRKVPFMEEEAGLRLSLRPPERAVGHVKWKCLILTNTKNFAQHALKYAL